MVSFKTNQIGFSKELTDFYSSWKPRNLCSQTYLPPLGLEELQNKLRELLKVPNTLDIIICQGAAHGLSLVYTYLRGLSSCPTFIEEPAYFGVYRLCNQQHDQFKPLSAASNAGIVYTTTKLHSHLLPDKSESWWQAQSTSVSFLIEDNPYDLTAINPPQPLSYSFSNVFTIGSFSKVFGTHLRAGYILCPKEHTSSLKSQLITSNLSGCGLTQHLILNLLEEDMHTTQANFYASLRNLFKSTPLKLHNGGITGRLDFNSPESLLEFQSKLVTNLEITAASFEPNTWSYSNNTEPPYLRLNYTLNPIELQHALDYYS